VAVATARLLANFLYEISASDPSTLSAVAVLVAVVALVAAYVPPRRATRVNPLIALTSE
jgi:putative ABC transport system permease protein